MSDNKSKGFGNDDSFDLAFVNEFYLNSQIGFYRTTPEGKILEANPAAVRLLEFNSLEELQKRNLEKEVILHQYSREKFKELISDYGKVTGLESVWLTKHGNKIYVRENARGVYDDKGNVVYYDGSIEDITALKEAEENLKAKTGQLQTFFDIVPDYLLIMNTDLTIIKVSRSWEKLLGYKISQIEGKNIIDFIHPDDRKPTKSVIAELIKRKTHNNSVNRYITKQGSYRYMEWFSQFHQGIVYAVARDVTDKVKEQRILGQIISSSEKFMVLSGKDIDYDILAWRMLKMTGAVAVGFNLKHINMDGLQTVALAGDEHSIAKAEAFLGHKITGHTWKQDMLKDKKISHSMTTCFTALSSLTRGTIAFPAVAALEKEFNLGHVYIIKIMDDSYVYGDFTILMPLRKKLEFQHLIEVYARQVGLLLRRANVEKVLNQKEEELLQASKMDAVGRFAGGIAHDFNNMLQSIMGYTEMAINISGDDRKRLKKYLQEIIHICKESNNMTKQLLAFAKKQSVVPIILNINDSLTEAQKMINQIVGSRITLDWNSGDAEKRIKIDPTQLKQVLVNLVINACDAVKDRAEPHISVTTGSVIIDDDFVEKHPESSPGNYHTMKVEDNGCGMNKETIKKVFEPFYTSKPEGEGTGLGLATVYGIVKQNDGFITVDSIVNRGSSFTVFLPSLDEDIKEEYEERAVFYKKRETILLVDDDENLIDLIREMILLTGRDVITATDPKEAIEIHKENKESIDLLVTDIAMPEINGQELWLILKKDDPGLRCLFISGYSPKVLKQQDIMTEKYEFLQKPFTISELENKLNNMK